MAGCPFYNDNIEKSICKLTKNVGFCNDSGNLLLCREYNRLKKISEIELRAKQISDRQKLKRGKRVRLKK